MPNKQLKLIFVGDIWGFSHRLDYWLSSITDNYLFIHPYDDEILHFFSEQQAYEYFMQEQGVPAYANKIAALLAEQSNDYLLVATSVGASACWYIGDQYKSKMRKCFMFYGSQIRHYLDIQQRQPTKLIFAAEEPHYSVDSLIKVLETQDTLVCEKSPYLHGFLNPKSHNFSELASKFYARQIADNLM